MSGTTALTPERTNRTTLRKVLYLAALLAFAMVWFGNLEYRDLVDPDEGRYAEIAREMAASGDWLTPRLNGLKYFEKPPLQYWATAALYSIFGVDEWVARLWPALAGLAGIALTFFAGRRLFGPRVAALGALILTGMLHYVIFAHILTLDMTVTLFLTLTILAVAIAQSDEAAERERRRWMLVAWAAMAGAVLSKGLIGIVLPVGALAVYIAVQRDWSLLKRLHAGTGTALLLALAAPWFVIVSIRNPEFARFFFWHEHVERFLLPGHHRPGAWWYFLAIGLAGALPWSALLLAGIPRWWAADRPRRFHPARLLVVWVALVTLFFSASSSKLPGYILPIFPALALLVALGVSRMRAKAVAAGLAVLLPFVLAALWLEPKAAHLKSQPDFDLYFGAFLPWLESATVVVALGLAAGALLAWRERTVAAIGATAGATLVALTIAMTADEALSPIFSAQHSATLLVAKYPIEARTLPFYSVRTFGQSLPFALGRAVTLVDYGGELDPGIDAEPEKIVRTLDAFRDSWLAADDAFAVMTPATFRELQAGGLPMTVVVQDPARVFVRRRAAAPSPD
jgi:4-amino-4-deoxy-L-arabinose transferase-like glycosyltransferase